MYLACEAKPLCGSAGTRAFALEAFPSRNRQDQGRKSTDYCEYWKRSARGSIDHRVACMHDLPASAVSLISVFLLLLYDLAAQPPVRIAAVCNLRYCTVFSPCRVKGGRT